MDHFELDHFRPENDSKRQPGATQRPRLVLIAIATVAVIVSFTTTPTSHSSSKTKHDHNTRISSSTSTNVSAGDPFQPTKFHQSGFGGVFNPAHPYGARARRQLSEKDIVIPKSAVKHAIPSLAKENILNLSGHYVHDEHYSPFSSFLYKRSKEELQKEQEEYEAKMNKVREEWGAWSFEDDGNVVRPIQDFSKIPYKDIKSSEWQENVWQQDKKYVTDFIAEAKKLVNRMMEGIYAEYGHPMKKSDGTILTADEIVAREELFKVHISDTPNHSGMSYINQAGMDALSRKLLHGMITNDEFYFVLGGHSAAAGHGNNFEQQKTMQFHHIMEPVFHKLGMRLISRNLAMGGLGTMHFSMGQAELYGEKDFLMWDSSMTEKNPGDIDLFNKQALIGGERVPIIFTQNINQLQQETNNSIWHGDISTDNKFIPLTTGYDQVKTLPYAAQYLKCDLTVPELCGDRNNPNKYDAHCWVPRSDYEPTRGQSPGFSSQASWHPGNRYHQMESRKAAMTILHGFKNALDLWENGIKEKGFPLQESYWHVGDMYKNVQESLKSYMSGEGKGKSECERHLSAYSAGMDRVCRTIMHGMGEFNPKNLGSANSISTHMINPNDLENKFSETYSGFDLLPQSWKIPDGEVDVHAIAIASTYKRPQIDQSLSGAGDGDDDSVEDSENSRMLRRDGSSAVEMLEVNDVERNLSEYSLLPGRGWGVHSEPASEITGFCDGSSMSFNCHRSINSNCLRSGHNDSRNGISGDGLSGWLIIKIPKLKEGLIFARLEWWHPRSNWYMTQGWTEVNGGHRSLGVPVPWPDDVFIDIAINGNIVETWDLAKFQSINKEISYNEAFYKFFDDESFISSEEGEPVEFGFRIRSESAPRVAGVTITHLYYA